jgi:hypothetical protein
MAALPRYLPVEIQIQNYLLRLKQWKLSWLLFQQYPNDPTVQQQLAEATTQLASQATVTVSALQADVV